jgi:hypothetical protein
MDDRREQGTEQPERRQRHADRVNREGAGEVRQNDVSRATGKLYDVYESQEVVAYQYDICALAGDIRA